MDTVNPHETRQATNSAIDPAVQRPLDIALVHAGDQGGGAERCVLTLHQTLRRLGHRSRLFVGSKQTDEPHVYEIRRERPIPGVLRITRWLENGMGWQNLYAPWFRELHRQIGAADVLHINTLWGGSFGYSDLTGLIRLARQYPTVMTLHDGFMLTGHCACPIQCERWQTGCGRCPDLKRAPAIPRDATALNWRRKRNAIQRSPLHVTTVSHWLKTQVEQSPIFAGKPVSVVHNSIDEAIFYPDSQQRARAELGLPADAFLVLLAGQSVEGIRQGVAQHAVAALNSLSQEGIVALVVGKSANEVVATLRVPSHVLPFQAEAADMARCYRAADLTVVSSEYETFGRVAAESLMCGTPVVTFATGGLVEVVDDGVTGLVVPTGDITGLAGAIRLLRNDRARRERFAETAVTRAHGQFNRRTICEQYLDVYRSAIAAHESGSLCRKTSD
jgi:glycosyltransferase involved in cell wall biosynthesis